MTALKLTSMGNSVGVVLAKKCWSNLACRKATCSMRWKLKTAFG